MVLSSYRIAFVVTAAECIPYRPHWRSPRTFLSDYRTLCESGVLDFAVCAAAGERSEEFDPGTSPGIKGAKGDTAPGIKGPKGDAALKLLHSGKVNQNEQTVD